MRNILTQLPILLLQRKSAAVLNSFKVALDNYIKINESIDSLTMKKQDTLDSISVDIERLRCTKEGNQKFITKLQDFLN